LKKRTFNYGQQISQKQAKALKNYFAIFIFCRIFDFVPKLVDKAVAEGVGVSVGQKGSADGAVEAER